MEERFDNARHERVMLKMMEFAQIAKLTALLREKILITFNGD